MDELAQDGGEVVITKRGKPVSKLIPYTNNPNNNSNPKAVLGSHKGRTQILGDIVSPMPAEWFGDPDESRNELF